MVSRLLIILFLFSFYFAMAQGIRSRFYLPEGTNNATRAVFEMSPHHYFGAGFSDKLTVMGLDSLLHPIWIKKYGSSKFQYLNNIYTARSFYKTGNNVFFIGAVRDSNNKQFGVLVKFDTNGDTLWQKIYRDTLEDIIPQMVTASVDGGFLITGFFQNWVNHTQPCLLIKTDINGNELWRKRLHKTTNPNVSDGKSIVQDSATKKIVVAGYQYFNGNDIYERILILDSVGNILASPYFSSYKALIVDMILTKDSKIVICGYQYDSQTIGGNNLNKAYAIKFDINNPSIPIWRTEIDKLTLGNGAHCLKEAKSGEIFVGGVIDTLSHLNKPSHCLVRIVRLDSSSGSIKDRRYYNYKTNDTLTNYGLLLKSLELTSDNGFVAGILSVNFPTPNPFFFVKYDSTGCDSSLAYCAATYTTKPSVDVGLKENLVIGSVNIYPRPCVDVMFIKSDFPIHSLQLFNLSGKRILTKTFDSHQSTYTIDVSHLAQGLYIAQLQTENGRQFVKVMKE